MAYVASLISEQPIVSAYLSAEMVRISAHIFIIQRALRGLRPSERRRHLQMILSRDH